MNFDREENQTPRITDLPEQNFEVPPQGFYVPENQTSNYSNFNQTESQNFETAQQVDPFTPPQFEEIKTPEGDDRQAEQNFEEREIANWHAPDMIIGEKSKRWYFAFFVVVAIFVVASLLLQMWSFAALIAVASVAIMVTRRESNQSTVSYSLSTRGIYIGNHFHPYDEFRYFGVIQESAIYSIVFVPKKRFSPSTSIYFDKQDGEKITDIIGQRLPMEQIKLDIIDRIFRKINL